MENYGEKNIIFIFTVHKTDPTKIHIMLETINTQQVEVHFISEGWIQGRLHTNQQITDILCMQTGEIEVTKKVQYGPTLNMTLFLTKAGILFWCIT